MILDGGPVEIGLESTIVDFTEDVPMVLRPGFVNLQMLRDVLGEVRTDPAILDANAGKNLRPRAPGMRYRHYAPKGEMVIVEGEPDAVTRYITARVREHLERGEKAGILCAEETGACYPEGLARSIGSRAEEDRIARELYAALREHGIRVPDDTLVIGWGDYPFSRFLDPPLATVRLPAIDIARRAMRRLLALIEGTAEPGPVAEYFPPELVLRGSMNR